MKKPVLACCLVALGFWHTASAQDAEPDAPPQLERARIARERTAATQQQALEEAQCQQRFAVEDCLRAVRRQARQRLSSLRQQEERLDEAQRQERAQHRLQAVEQRQQEHALQAPAGATSGVPARQAKAAPAPSMDPRAHAQKQQQVQADKARRRAALQEHASAQRREHLEKEEAALQRKAQRDARKAADAARGRPPAAPLPAASAAQ